MYTKHIPIPSIIGILIVLIQNTFQSSPIGVPRLVHLFDFVEVLH
jgi:hypothetical protein